MASGEDLRSLVPKELRCDDKVIYLFSLVWNMFENHSQCWHHGSAFFRWYVRRAYTLVIESLTNHANGKVNDCINMIWIVFQLSLWLPALQVYVRRAYNLEIESLTHHANGKVHEWINMSWIISQYYGAARIMALPVSIQKLLSIRSPLRGSGTCSPGIVLIVQRFRSSFFLLSFDCAPRGQVIFMNIYTWAGDTRR